MQALIDASCDRRIDWPVMTIAADEHGVFITAPCWIASTEPLESLPDDPLAVFRFARQHGVPLTRFDADADILNELPTYDW